LKEENDQALEELVMQNPHLADAFAALKDLSADPEARELAWRRVEAEATAEHELAHAKKKARDDGREEGLEEGLQRGLEQGLERGLETATRDAIVTTARAFGVEVTPAREAALQALDLAGLKAFFQALLQQRAWPSSAP
jgi:flagellar biosynthesis/type III secretory pathway protein FliH